MARLLRPIADRLDKLSASDGWSIGSPVGTIFSDMKHVQAIELHHNMVWRDYFVFDFHRLAELRSITVVGTATPASQYLHAEILWFLRKLPPSIQRLSLPRHLTQLCTPAEAKALEDRAAQGQFELVWT